MSTQVTKAKMPAARRPGLRNYVTFPRGLRDAIPDMPTCIGRVLELDSMEGKSSNTQPYGRRVNLKLLVKETGKLTGEFVVSVDLQPDAARELADTLTQLAEQAERK